MRVTLYPPGERRRAAGSAAARLPGRALGGVVAATAGRPTAARRRHERPILGATFHFGKPCVAGTRIPVVDVLELIGEGISFEQIRKDFFPDLEPEDLRACVRYAIALADTEEIQLAASA